MRRILSILALWTAASAAAASVCAEASATAWPDVVAALEPGLTAGRATGMSDDATVVARFLAAAASSAEERPDPGDALDAFARAYAVARPAASTAADARSSWASTAATAVRPHAVLVTDDDRRRTVTHAAVFWSSPLAQRLRIVRIPEELRTDANREAILDLLGTCVVEVEEWVSAPESRTLAFLTEHVRASMLVVGRDPATGATVEGWIGPDEVIEALRFEHPLTKDLDEFSAWFAGAGPAPLALTRLIPTLRSSMGPGDLLALVRSLR